MKASKLVEMSQADMFPELQPMAASIEDQTGWKRPFPEALCDVTAVLMSVHEYDFNVREPEFDIFLYENGLSDLLARTGAAAHRFILSFDKGLPDFMADPTLRISDRTSTGGGTYVYTGKEMRKRWNLVKLVRGKIQDAWEVYNNKKKSEPSDNQREAAISKNYVMYCLERANNKKRFCKEKGDICGEIVAASMAKAYRGLLAACGVESS